jgi:hypothetical protein
LIFEANVESLEKDLAKERAHIENLTSQVGSSDNSIVDINGVRKNYRWPPNTLKDKLDVFSIFYHIFY